MGKQGPPGPKHDFFFKMILDHTECQNRCFWQFFSPWWPVLALLKYPNALKMGYFGTKKGSKMCFFQK